MIWSHFYTVVSVTDLHFPPIPEALLTSEAELCSFTLKINSLLHSKCVHYQGDSLSPQVPLPSSSGTCQVLWPLPSFRANQYHHPPVLWTALFSPSSPATVQGPIQHLKTYPHGFPVWADVITGISTTK